MEIAPTILLSSAFHRESVDLSIVSSPLPPPIPTYTLWENSLTDDDHAAGASSRRASRCSFKTSSRERERAPDPIFTSRRVNFLSSFTSHVIVHSREHCETLLLLSHRNTKVSARMVPLSRHVSMMMIEREARRYSESYQHEYRGYKYAKHVNVKHRPAANCSRLSSPLGPRRGSNDSRRVCDFRVQLFIPPPPSYPSCLRSPRGKEGSRVPAAVNIAARLLLFANCGAITGMD